MVKIVEGTNNYYATSTNGTVVNITLDADDGVLKLNSNQ